MPPPKPTLGYPSRTAAVVALRASGRSSHEIANAIGITTATVAALEHSAGRRPRRPAEAHGRTVLFPTDILEALRPHAVAREISPNELARRIVDTVVDEGLIDAVLDDGAASSVCEVDDG